MVYAKIIQKAIPFSGSKRFHQVLSKVKVISAADGKCEAELTVAEEHTNIGGTLHGGLSATLVDVISAFALLTHPKMVKNLVHDSCPKFGASVNIHIEYLRPVNIGDEILVQGSIIKTGNTLAFLETIIRDKKTSNIVVRGTQTYFVGEN